MNRFVTRGRAWTFAADEFLADAYEARHAKTVPEIAAAMDRTQGAIKSRASTIGLVRHPEWLSDQGVEHAAKITLARIVDGHLLHPPQAWPDHEFEDEPRIAARWKRATPKPMPIPTPDRTLAGVVSMD